MSKNKNLIPVRLSHLLTYCSVGAIVRGPHYLLTVRDIRDWTDKDGKVAGQTIHYVDGVRAALGISQELRIPPLAKELENGQADGVCVPAMRFPSWMRCPKCGLLYYRPWRSQDREDPRCSACKTSPELKQVSWLLAHSDGYMDDIPWHYMAHREAKSQNQKQCGADPNEAYLTLTDKGVANRVLYCTRCKAIHDFGDSMTIPYVKTQPQPWSKDPPVSVNDSSELAYVLEVNDARVHAPSTRNALVIPPESRIRQGTVVDRLFRNSQARLRIDNAKMALARKSAMKTLAWEFSCPIEEIQRALDEIQKGYPFYGENITRGLLLESEYQALLEEIPAMAEDEDFVTRHNTRYWKAMSETQDSGSRLRKIIAIVSQLVSVDRLKEIQILKGFQRLGGKLVPPDLVGQSAWLPAIELYGEGIFFTLEEEVLTRWQTLPGMKARARDFHIRYVDTGLQFEPDIKVSVRFLMLHTLAHLLIRQLEIEAGYPAASLKERIYCTTGKMPMGGILIYVAVPDMVGSLGGLAELAEPHRFLSLLSSVFDHADWCSLDPVCSEHEGQGPNQLNRAACHACALAPETSCAYGNVLLDRTFIKGDLAVGIPAFLDFV